MTITREIWVVRGGGGKISLLLVTWKAATCVGFLVNSDRRVKGEPLPANKLGGVAFAERAAADAMVARLSRADRTIDVMLMPTAGMQLWLEAGARGSTLKENCSDTMTWDVTT